MARFVGRIAQTETHAPIPNLVVRVFRLAPAAENERTVTSTSLGSDATDAAGRFEIVARMSEGESSLRVVLAVASPERAREPRPQNENENENENGGERIEVSGDSDLLDASSYLLVTPVQEVASDADETYRLTIDAARLEEAGVPQPEAAAGGLRFSLRARRAIQEAIDIESEVGDVIADRVREDRSREDGELP
jgi:hypothetical protein